MVHLNTRLVSCLLALVASGCAGIPRPALIDLPAADAQRQFPRPRLDESIQDVLDRQDTQSLIDETFSVIESAEFLQNLLKLDGPLSELWLSPYGETLSPEQLAVAYLGIDPNHRPVPSTLVWGTRELTGPSKNDPAEARIEMSRDKLSQWRSASLTHKSCAINTLAHELTHTVSRAPGQYVYLFADRGRPWAGIMGRPLASYTVGALAQCTYLQQRGAPEAKDLRQCLNRWGTSNFYSYGCDPKAR